MYGDILGHTRNFRDQQYEWNQMLYGFAVTLVFGAIWSSSSLQRRLAKRLQRPRT